MKVTRLTKLDLVPLTVMARELGITPYRLARRLQTLELSFKRKILHGGGTQRKTRLVDRAYLGWVLSTPGKSFEQRLDRIEQDLEEIKLALHEHLGLSIGE